MKPLEREKISNWIENWRENGRFLDQLRLEEFRSAKLSDILLSLSDVTESAVLAHTPSPSSGIIEMQRWFAKLRK